MKKKDVLVELFEGIKKLNKGNKNLKIRIDGKRSKRKPNEYWMGIPVYITKKICVKK